MGRISKIYAKIANLRPSGFWPGFIIGLIYFSYIFRWYWPLFPLTNLGIESKISSFFLILFMFSLSVLGTAFFWGLFSFFIIKLIKKNKPLIIPLATGGLFVIVEYARAWGFGFLWIGGENLFGPHWTLGNPVYLLSSFPFVLKFASVWGIYGIDFLIIWILSLGFLLAGGVYKIRSRIFLINIGLLFFLFFLTLGLSVKIDSASKMTPIKVALLQTKIKSKPRHSPDETLEDYAKKLEMIKEASKNIGKGLIIFPESSNFSQFMFNFLDDESIKKFFDELSSDELMIIDNNILSSEDGNKSRTLFINSKDGISGFYDKQLLTPAGEYLPQILKFFLFALREKPASGYSNLTQGKHSELLDYEKIKINTIVCSETVSPNISSRNNSNLLISLQNLGSFKGSPIIESQYLSMLKFRAAENGKYALLASNFGRSYIIKPDGKIEKMTDFSGYQILTAEVVPNDFRTWYNKLGDLPILLVSLMFFGLSLKRLENDESN